MQAIGWQIFAVQSRFTVSIFGFEYPPENTSNFLAGLATDVGLAAMGRRVLNLRGRMQYQQFTRTRLLYL